MFSFRVSKLDHKQGRRAWERGLRSRNLEVLRRQGKRGLVVGDALPPYRKSQARFTCLALWASGCGGGLRVRLFKRLGSLPGPSTVLLIVDCRSYNLADSK